MDAWFRNLFKGGSGTKSISYQTARKLARDTNPAVRRELAGRDDVAPEILVFLADDPEPEVRQAIAAGNKEVGLKVKITPAEDFEQRLSDLGIVEIIGTGTSSFAGSPSNRRHNIKIGAAAVNGTLIKPGEEF